MLQELFNVIAEQSVLASLLYDPECAAMATDLSPDDFGAPEHGEIFRWLAVEVSEGRRPSAMAIMPRMAGVKIGGLDGKVYILRLMQMNDRPSVREALMQVKAFSARRSMSWIGDVLKEQAQLADSQPRGTCIEAIKALNDVIAIERRRAVEPAMIGDIAAQLVDSLDDPDDGRMISTGLKTLDKFMGGWPRGELSIMAGRPSMGKSALMTAVARRGAKRGINIMIFSLEMPRGALAARMLSDYAYSSREDQRIPYSDIIQRKLSSAQKQRLASALDTFRTYPIKIDDQRGLSMPEIQIRALRYADELDKQGKRLDIVMVDHLGKIKANDRYKGNTVAETTEKSDALMNMSYEVDVSVLAACQLNRQTEGREDKHPQPSDLRDTGALEQDAHTVIFPYRHAYYLERQKIEDYEKDQIRLMTLEKKKNCLEILVSKCRNGACGTVDVFVDMPCNHVEDLLHAA